LNDMVLDSDNTRISYVVVGTGGFLDLGEREILVPWDSLQLQTGTGDTTGGQQNAFILQTDLDTFRNAPDFDLTTNLPQAGQPAGDWDADIRSFWEGGGTANTPAAEGTPAADMTATTDGTGQGTDQATATAGTDQGQATATAGTDQGQGQGTALQGIVLASEVLGSTITLSPGQGQGQSQGQGQDQATATASTDQGQATATPSADQGQATATAGTGQGAEGVGNFTGTIDDMIVDTDTGGILYIVVNTTFDEGERWIPVPLGFIQWDATNGAFLLNANPAAIREAPFFQNDQFPDTTVEGWNSEFDTFWQNVGPGGSGGAEATATP
jgi:hypothetical protein